MSVSERASGVPPRPTQAVVAVARRLRRHDFDGAKRCAARCLAILALSAAGCEVSEAHPRSSSAAVIDGGTMEVLDLGTVAPGSRVERQYAVTNRSGRPWHIARVLTSCECVSIAVGSKAVSPGESAQLLVVADFSDDSSYEGDLGVLAQVLEADERLLTSFDINVGVHQPSDAEG